MTTGIDFVWVHLRGTMSGGDAIRWGWRRTQCAMARDQAVRNGIAFTPIHWHLADNGEIIMTLWEIA